MRTKKQSLLRGLDDHLSHVQTVAEGTEGIADDASIYA